jgi:hypothetical protein
MFGLGHFDDMEHLDNIQEAFEQIQRDPEKQRSQEEE